MKRALVLFCFLLSPAFVSVFAAEPVISNITLSQEDGKRTLVIAYDLAVAPAVVTVEILTNGVAVAHVSGAEISGDGNRKVSVGTGRKISYRPSKALKGLKIEGVGVRLKAWPIAAPPDYAVWDLSAADVPASLRFYPDEKSLPGGILDPVYATTHLVMRKIHAGAVTCRLGTNNVQGDERDDRCIPRLVTFTRDYYIGVFELTQGQSAYFWTPPTAPDGSTRDEAARLPLNMVSFGDVRGVTKGRLWPAQGETLAVAHQVDEGSLVFALRAKIGVDAFDLPTSAQWEFAYRAGSKLNHYWGYDRARDYVAAEFLAATNNAWTAHNSSSVQRVGTRLPNAWGLYDMAGNVLEMHLDRFAQGEALSDGSDQIDPRGSADADAAFRMAAGGSYHLNAETETIPHVSAVGFDKLDATARLAYLGLRLQCDARFLVDND